MPINPLFSGLSNGGRLLLFIALIILGAALSIAIAYIVIVLVYGTAVVQESALMSNIGSLRWMQILNQIGLFIFPSLAFVLLTETKVKASLGFFKPDRMHLLATVFLIVAISPLVGKLMEWNEAMQLPDSMHAVESWMRQSEDKANELVQWMLSYGDPISVIINIIMIVLLPAIGEELLFRAVLIKITKAFVKNIHIAVWVSAIIFSAFHFQFYGFLPRMLLGLAFGYIFIWSGSIWVPILAHFINNGTVVLINYLNSNDIISTSPEEFGSVDSPIIILISIILASLIAFYLYKTNKAYRLSVCNG